MVSRPLSLLFSLVALAGCLQDGPAPSGQLLFHGETLEQPGFFQVGNDHYVRFVNRLATANSSHGAIYDIWTSTFDGTTQQKVVSAWSDRWASTSFDDLQQYDYGYFWVDERTIPSGTGPAVVGSWIRLTSAFKEVVRLEDVSNASAFSAPLAWLYDNPDPRLPCPGFPDLHDSCPQALFERPPPVGQTLPTLYLWDGQAQTPIGPDSGGFAKQIVGNGTVYCVLGDKQTLSRLRRPAMALESLRDHVSSFQISGDEHYAVLTVKDDKPKVVVRDLRTGNEIVPLRPSPSVLLGFAANIFSYAQNTSPVELHQLNLDTGVDTFITLPPQLTSYPSTVSRTAHPSEVLRIDSALHGLFTGSNDWVPLRPALTADQLWQATFTPDGAYIMYMKRATSTLAETDKQGALMFQSADHTDQPPAMVSPPGLLLDFQVGAPYFFVNRDDAGNGLLAFWAHLGRAASDLYFVDYTAGSLPTNLRLVAQSIMSVSVSPHNLFGIVNVSQQDGVGDLVYRDLDAGTDIRYAQAVSDAAELPLGSDLSTTWSAYVVRGRDHSERAGLWLTTLAPPSDAGVN